MSHLRVRLTLVPGFYLDVAPWDHDRQKLRNRWAVPPRFTSARCPGGPITVLARLMWTLDGAEWAPGRAMGWTRRQPSTRVTSPYDGQTHRRIQG